MRPQEIDEAVSVWRAANIARGAPHGRERTQRVHAKLSAPDGFPFVAVHVAVIGMALAEPGRFDRGRSALDPSLLHTSMVFVRPAEQGRGIGLAMLHRVFEFARAMSFEHVDVWTAESNVAARRLYENAGMARTGETQAGRIGLNIRYLITLGDQASSAGHRVV